MKVLVTVGVSQVDIEQVNKDINFDGVDFEAAFINLGADEELNGKDYVFSVGKFDAEVNGLEAEKDYILTCLIN